MIIAAEKHLKSFIWLPSANKQTLKGYLRERMEGTSNFFVEYQIHGEPYSIKGCFTAEELCEANEWLV